MKKNKILRNKFNKRIKLYSENNETLLEEIKG